MLRNCVYTRISCVDCGLLEMVTVKVVAAPPKRCPKCNKPGPALQPHPSHGKTKTKMPAVREVVSRRMAVFISKKGFNDNQKNKRGA